MPVDQQVLVAGTASAPLSYTVPNATEIQLLAVNATVNGAAAASGFLPAIEIVSDGGVVVARVPTLTEVAAGGSAEVTFAPGLVGESAASTSYTYLTAVISVSSSATVVAAIPGHVIRVVSVGLMADGFVNVSFTGTAALTGAVPLAPNTGFVLGPHPEGHYWFQTAAGGALGIVLSAGANVGGVLTYEVV